MADMVEVYGIDLYDPTYDSRPWPWLRDLIWELLTTPRSRLYRALIGTKQS